MNPLCPVHPSLSVSEIPACLPDPILAPPCDPPRYTRRLLDTHTILPRILLVRPSTPPSIHRVLPGTPPESTVNPPLNPADTRDAPPPLNPANILSTRLYSVNIVDRVRTSVAKEHPRSCIAIGLFTWQRANWHCAKIASAFLQAIQASSL